MKTDILLANTYFFSIVTQPNSAICVPTRRWAFSTLLGYVREQGYGVQVYDNTFRPDEQAFFRALEDSNARIVGFHSMFICRPSAERLIKGAKERGCTVICGARCHCCARSLPEHLWRGLCRSQRG